MLASRNAVASASRLACAHARIGQRSVMAYGLQGAGTLLALFTVTSAHARVRTVGLLSIWMSGSCASAVLLEYYSA